MKKNNYCLKCKNRLRLKIGDVIKKSRDGKICKIGKCENYFEWLMQGIEQEDNEIGKIIDDRNNNWNWIRKDWKGISFCRK